MNAQKIGVVNNNGWILCPSKSFPGKFYYFNVVSGEAVWCLNDNEKNIPKKENRTNLQKIHNSCHGYPEPNTLPENTQEDSPTNIWPNTPVSSIQPQGQIPLQSRSFTRYAPPMFGQPAKFVSNMEQLNMPMANMVWMPIQFPMPTWPYMASDMKKPTEDRVTQTSRIERDIYVQASGTPLCQRFVNYEIPILNFNKENKIIKQPNRYVSSTLKNSNAEMEFSRNEIPVTKFIPDSIMNMERKCFGKKSADNFQNSDIEKCIFGALHKKGIQSMNSCVTSDNIELSKGKLSLGFSNKLVISKPVIEYEETQRKDIKLLDKSDLRFLLMAKRKKLQEEQLDLVERKKSKLHEPSPLPKKKVTFNMDIINIDSCSNENYECLPSTSTISSETSSTNRILSQPEPSMDSNKILIKEREINKNKMYDMSINNMGTVNISTKDNQPIPSKNNMQEKTTKNIKPEEGTQHVAIKRNMQNNNMPNENTVYSSAKDITKENKAISNLGMKVTISDPNKDVWYVVVDMDILLDDHMFVDQLLKSDEKYKLLIPHALRAEIESLCIGDCRGQQRVFVARQISRRLAVHHKQYVVDHTPDDEDGTINTTDSILKSCVRVVKEDKYLVLITNDPHLLARANALNIHCYKPQEIKNGTIVNPKLFSELKKIKVTVDNDGTYEDSFIQNKSDDVLKKSYPVDTYKKRLFVNEENTDKSCDILINITKPKSKNNDNIVKYDTPIEISHRVQKLNLRDPRKIAFNNQSFPHNDENTTNVSNSVDISPNVKYSNNDDQNQKLNSGFDSNSTSNVLKNDTERIKDILNSIPNINDRYSASTVNMSDINSNLDLLNDKNNNNGNVKTTAARHRIEKIISAVTKTSKSNQNEPKSNEIFKYPNLIPPKKDTSNTSALNEGSSATDNIRSNFNNSRVSLENRLKKFCVKNEVMYVKIRSRMDEWICTYTQIMEGLLNDILPKNREYNMIKMSTSASSLHESLTCLKVLYDNTELRDIVEGLVELLVKCTCDKGKLKLDTTPKDFMKILGFSILLVITLKTILPTDEALTDYAFYCDSLLSNIESQNVELDPELLRPTTSNRSEIGDENIETRLIYRKEPSVVLDYLKKHFKEWSNYDDNQNYETKPTKKPEEFKVVRIFGKNLNLLKIDNNKSISYTEAPDNESPPNKNGTKLVRLLDKNQPLSKINDHNIIEKNYNGPVLRRNTTSNENQNKIDDTENNSATNKDLENYPMQGHNIAETNENADQKIIRNINLIDAYKDKMNKEPLDLDLLDYSENTYESTIKCHENYEINHKDMEASNENNVSNNSFSQNNEIMQDNQNDAVDNDFYSSRKNNQDLILYQDINTNNNDDCVNKEAGSRSNNITADSNMNSHNENYGIEDLTTGENYATSNHNYAVNNDSAEITSRADSPNDSGFENESTQAHMLVKMFLIELSSTFKIIYEFATDFVEELRREMMCQNRKNILHIKASRCLQDMVAIIQQLRSIIKRESHEDTVLKNLLLRAGVEAASDKRVTRYRQIIRKCLEQAQILEGALRIIICITIGDLGAISTNADSISSSIRYINIFE